MSIQGSTLASVGLLKATNELILSIALNNNNIIRRVNKYGLSFSALIALNAMLTHPSHSCVTSIETSIQLVEAFSEQLFTPRVVPIKINRVHSELTIANNDNTITTIVKLNRPLTREMSTDVFEYIVDNKYRPVRITISDFNTVEYSENETNGGYESHTCVLLTLQPKYIFDASVFETRHTILRTDSIVSKEVLHERTVHTHNAARGCDEQPLNIIESRDTICQPTYNEFDVTSPPIQHAWENENSIIVHEIGKEQELIHYLEDQQRMICPLPY